MARPPSVGPFTWLDFSILVLAVDCGRQAAPNNPVQKTGEALLRRYLDDLKAGTDLVIQPLMERNDASSMKTLFHMVETAPSTVDAYVERYPPFLDKFFTWAGSRANVLRSTFPKKAYPIAIDLVKAMDVDDPVARLRLLAQMPAASGMTAPRQWVQQLAKEVGVPPTNTQVLLADALTASAVADELRDVRQQLSFADPMTDKAAELYDKKRDVEDRLHDVVSKSVDPSAVRAATLSTLSDPMDGLIKKYTLTEEQARVVLSEGKVVVAAGAGSGKTSTVVALIEHLVKVRGYDPAEILACSFTRAASAELSSRVETKAGVTGARVGTTHSIARDIIRRNRPDVARYMNNTENAEKLFKMAIQQVAMSAATFQQQVNDNAKWMAFIEGIKGWRYNNFLTSLYDQLSRGRTLSEKQIEVLNRWGKKASGMPVEAAADGGGERMSPYTNSPVGQWFNLGDKDILEQSPKRLQLAISNLKNTGITVDMARATYGDTDLITAVYGAYEWLKKNDTILAPAMDFDDQIILAHQILKTDARALAAEQRRFKAVIVDEAQDLNQIQFEFFSMLGNQAKNLLFVGDDKQCVDINAKVQTGKGITKTVGSLRVGDAILSYVNGQVEYQIVSKIAKSDWTSGRRVTTASGKTLLMSPNHRLWATPPVTTGGQVAVYLMHRSDKGFRVGTVLDTDFAERAWVLDICPDKDAAVKKELQYRGVSGSQILVEQNVGFDYPHFLNVQDAVSLVAHTGKGTVVRAPGNPAVSFHTYNDAVAHAVQFGGAIQHTMYLKSSYLMEIHAASLHVNMQIPVRDANGNVTLDTITSIEDSPGTFVDLEVEGAANFFANDVLTHNSIYAFRGAAPTNYIGLSKNPEYQTLLMTTNFRSGSSIVGGANTLIRHNEDRQIPMVCQAHPTKGEGDVKAVRLMTHAECANYVADEIQQGIKADDSPNDFGILVRNNAEADDYTLALLVRGIPYRTINPQKGGFFGKPAVRAMVAWLRLIVGGTTDQVNTAVIEAHAVPGFGMNKAFAGNLARRVMGETYLDYIQRGEPVYTDNQSWRNKNVKNYADAIRQVRVLGQMDSASLLKAILGIQGIKKTFLQDMASGVELEDLEVKDMTPEKRQELMEEQARASVQPLFTMAETYKDPLNLLNMIVKMQDANLKVQKDSPGETSYREPAVLVGTVHGWKGLQAKHVYVSMAGGIFPSKFAEEQSDMDEERRLAYVALTRGEEGVTVMSPSTNYLGFAAPPSPFISEACIREVGLGSDATPTGKTARSVVAASHAHVMDAYSYSLYGGSDDDV